jgi:hypothetical protein
VTHRTILYLILAAAAIGLTAAAAVVTARTAPGHIELSAAEFDFGTVPNTAPVSQTFQVRNVGDGPLSITAVSTSCGCTTASVDDTELEPGEATDLTVIYDPLAHDGALGEFLRVVYVRSDDPGTPEATLTIRVRVVEAQPVP